MLLQINTSTDIYNHLPVSYMYTLPYATAYKAYQYGVLCRLHQYRKGAHLSCAHASIPIERLEAAVAAVPKEAFSADQADLNRFAEPHLFSW